MADSGGTSYDIIPPLQSKCVPGGGVGKLLHVQGNTCIQSDLACGATGGRGTRKGEERRANNGGDGVGGSVGGGGRGGRGGGNRRGRGASSARGEIWDSCLMIMTVCHQLTR